jgi:mRNA interferase RelE/StbE
MASYRVLIKRSAGKEIRNLPTRDRRRVVSAIQGLAADPRPPGSQRLSGREAYRVRLGRYRVVYTIEDAHLVVEVIRVAHRREAYR